MVGRASTAHRPPTTPEVNGRKGRGPSPVRSRGDLRPRRTLARPRRARTRHPRPLGRRRRLRREPAPAGRGPRVGVLRGSAHRQRPTRASTTCGPGSSRTSTPASRPCGAGTSPARADGTATASRSRCRSSRSSASTTSTRSRPSASASSTGCAGSRSTATSPTSRRSPVASACGSTPTTPTGRSTTRTSRRSGGCSARCGTPATSTRATRSCPTAGAAAPRCRATSSASPARTRTSPSRRCTCASPWSTATSTSWCGRPPRGRWCRTSAPRSAPRSSTCGCKGDDGRRDLVMGAARVADVLGDDAEVVGPVAVDELVGLHYERPFDSPRPMDDSGARIVAADFVTVDDGSGIVHLAPAFGEIDREVADVEGLPMLNPVGPAATFVDTPLGTTPWAGTFVKDADPAIIDALAAAGKLERVVDYTHSYPHCWRCSTPLIYWAKPTWFARTSAHKDELLRENETIGWHPEHIKHGRFGDWLENNVDWALSRDRFWGTPLPVWRCDDCGTDTCIGSVAELSERSGRDLTDLDLHRPAVDDVTIDCPKCERPGARRVDPVLDAWFDSGAMPAAQFHHPFETHERRQFATRFPADFICEAIDQTRGLVLLAARGQHARVRTDAVPQRRVPGAGRRQGRPEDVEVEGQRHRSVDGARHARVPTRCGGTSSPPARRGRRGACRWRRSTSRPASWSRSGTPTRSSSPTRTSTAGHLRPTRAPDERTPTHVLDRWVRSRLHHTVAAVTDALDGVRRAARRAGARRVRRRPLELVRAPFARALLERRTTRARARDAARVPLHAGATARAVHAVRRRRAAPQPRGARTSRCTSPTGPSSTPPRSTTRSRPRWSGRAQSCRSGCRPATRRSSRCASRCAAHWCCSPTGARSPTDVAAEVADALNVKQLEAVTDLEGLLEYAVVPNFKALAPRVARSDAPGEGRPARPPTAAR